MQVKSQATNFLTTQVIADRAHCMMPRVIQPDPRQSVFYALCRLGQRILYRWYHLRDEVL